MGHDDVKVYMVDPREDIPCLRELSLIYDEQLIMQKKAIEQLNEIEQVTF